MFDLYIAECRRFARWAAGAAALHLAGLLLLTSLIPGLRESSEICLLVCAGYALAALIFGFYQSASYGRMNHWIALLHRPLAPWRIMLGVLGAALTALLTAIVVPLVLYTALQGLKVDQVVDTRHWLLIVAAAIIAVTFFLAGSYAALAPRRYGWAGLFAAAILTIGTNASGVGALASFSVTAMLFALLVVGAFRPDRSVAPAQPVLLGLTAGVAALSVYFLLLMGGGFAYQMTLVALGRNPLVNTPPTGGLVEASRADSGDLIDRALAVAGTRDAAAVRAQLRGVEAKRLTVAVDWLPRRDDLLNEGPITFVDQRRSIQWTYSNDLGAFRGTQLKTRQSAGTLATAGGFVAPPFLIGESGMLAGNTLYRPNSATGGIDAVARIADGEVIVARPATAGQTLALLGTRALYLIDTSAISQGGPPAQGLAVPFTGAVGNMRRIDLARLPDQVIVSFFYGRDAVEGPAEAWQHVVSVRHDGTVRTLARHHFAPELSDALRYRAYWLSPAIRLFAKGAEALGAAESPVQVRSPIRVPRRVWLAAGLVAVVAACMAFLLARRRGLSTAAQTTWLLATLLVGLPMLVAFWLVGPNRKHLTD